MLVTKPSGGGGSGLSIKGSIAVASDFPTLATVKLGRVYKVTATVTDNDPTKTNTGLSFRNGDIIYWDGSTWLDVTGLETWIDNGSTVTPINLRDINVQNKNILNINESFFSTAPTLSASQVGKMYRDPEEDTMSFDVTNGSIAIGKETFDYYTNLSGVTLVDGDVVSIVGVSGNRNAVALTDATNGQSATACIGMVTDGAIAGGVVRVTKIGAVHKLNTNTFTEGLPVYVDPANHGKLTQTVPTAPNYLINVGIVTVKNINNGVIDVVLAISPKLQDLSDVNGTVLNTTGQIPVRHEPGNYFDFDYKITNDATLSASSSYNVPSEYAVKTYADTVDGNAFFYALAFG